MKFEINGRPRRKLKFILGFLVFLGFASLIYRTSVFRITKNFAVVEDGKLYRSAQLTTAELHEVIEKYKIKTVISLRGSPAATSYYENEADTLERLHVNFVPVALRDETYPDENNLKEIFHQFDHGEYPMLIHCRVGADRTGLIAALYQLSYMNKTLAEASQQLSFKHWHVSFLKPAMNQFLNKFQGVNWVMTNYHVCSPEFDDYREIDHVCKK